MNRPLLIVFVCLLVSCGPLHHINFKLDSAQLEKLKVADTIRTLHKHDVESKLFRLTDGSYKEVSTRMGIQITAYRYFYPSGRLKTWERVTAGFKYGKSPIYDENGNLVNVTDYDAPFKYSINRLDAKFAFGYGINIFKEGTEVTRSTDNGHPLYRITIPFSTPYNNKERHFVVDGITGKTLSDETVAAAHQEPPIIPQN